MDSTTNYMTGPQLAQLISEGRLCPYPRPVLPRHLDNNPLIEQVQTMTPEQRQAYLAERRKQRAYLREQLVVQQSQ